MHPRMQNAVLRLYLAMMLLGIHGDDDDDDNAALIAPLEDYDKQKIDEIKQEATKYYCS